MRQSEKAYAAGNVAYLFVLENNRKLFDARAKAAAQLDPIEALRHE